MSDCPDRRDLEALLLPRPDEGPRVLVAAHVEGCPDCQAVLEELTHPSIVWGAVDAPTFATSKDPADARSTAGMVVPEVPGYEIIGELGRGGMGVVHRAVNLRLNRPCALKMILATGAAAEGAVLRFLAEAEAIARLRHPNVVQTFHMGEHDGRPFLEMELVEGGPLSGRIDGTPWPPPDAARMIEPVARAIHEAHRRGIVHRDLKPANILMAADGTPKISDFGLAKLQGIDAGLTRTEMILGSPSYMAPEQAEGKAREVGPAADVHALGSIFYELLVGGPPFRGATVLETLDQVKHLEPVSPSRLVPGVPRDAETIAMKCLEKAPARRYATAGDLADDLGRFLAGEPISARPPSPWERWGKFASRNRAAVAGGLGVVAALLIGAVVSTAFALAEARQHRLAVAAVGRADEARRIAEREAYQARLMTALAALGDHRIADATRQLEAVAPDRRGWEWRYLQGRLDASLARVDEEPPLGIAGACFLEGGAAAYLTDRSRIFLRDVEGRRPDVGFDREPGEAVWPVGGGRGGLIRAGAAGELRLLGPDGRLVREFHADDRRPVAAVAISRKGRRLAAYYPADRPDATPTVRIFDTADGTNRRIDHGVLVMDFSPDERLLAISSGDTTSVWDVETGRRVADLLGYQRRVFSLAFHPEGSRLLTGMEDQSLREWEARTGRRLREFADSHGPIRAVAYSPDGRWIVWSGDDGPIRLRDARTGEAGVVLDGHRRQVNALAFNGDGSRLLSVDEGPEGRSIRLWDVPSMLADPTILRGHDSYLYAVAVDPLGRWIATGAWDNVIRLWDAASGLPVAVLEGHSGWISDLAFSPDGGRLASRASDSTVRIWDPAAREMKAVFREVGWDRWCPQGLAFRPDGAVLAAADHGRVRLWDVGSGRERPPLDHPIHSAQAVAFSPDGRRLAVSGDDTDAAVIDAETGRSVTRLRGHADRIPTIAYSPDGLRLLTGSEDHTARLWDATDGRPLAILRGHRHQIYSAIFHPDGTRIATAGRDRSIRIWDASRGDEFLRLEGHQDYVMSLAFTPDGATLVSGSGDRTARLWDTFPLARRLGARANPPADGSHGMTSPRGGSSTPCSPLHGGSG
ncbi:WD40 repeat domain-containing serine/threonine protein kinase [Aquisphaera insulae]|uniref:WD40 repeat domain-containing serine/threonine protein kinase n=1 Tax=Aquisphaera insulae TaxID=2712864 RepID=UPI0013EDFE80|nr:serine/threonine-protein kinase [Aquisphaera insulae]